MAVRGFFIISGVVIIILNLGGSRERRITRSRRLPRSPLHDGHYERCSPECETEPEKYGSGSFGVTPIGQSVFETVITVPCMGVFLCILTPGLRPSGDCRNEAEGRGMFRAWKRLTMARRTRAGDLGRFRFRSV